MAQFGQMLKQASEENERFVVERAGKPSVIIMSLRDYIRNLAPTPEAHRRLREEAAQNGSASISAREIEAEITAVRRPARKRIPRPPT
jgi:PHD/YefM family antitoxin component YafN of YafNO toxin-antitoxin module